MATELRDVINKGPMSNFQIVAVAICFILNMLDGFDVLVISFTAPSIAREWGVSNTDIGSLFSAGLFGMTFGSLLLSPVADILGRRLVILGSLVVVTVGMLLSSTAPDIGMLRIYRFVTGVGIGGILASMSVITAEYSSDKWRSAAIAIMSAGYGFGATLGGMISAILIAAYSWRAPYVFGALFSAAMIPIVAWRLPESLDFLVNRRPSRALEQLNVLMKRMGRELVDKLPEPTVLEAKINAGFNSLFSRDILRSTIFIWLAFFFLLSNIYFVLNWTPQLFVSAGGSNAQGINIGVWLNIGGIGGGLLFAFLTTRYPLRLLTCSFLFIGAVTISLIGTFIDQISMAMVSAVFTGFFMTGAVGGFYSITPALYPPTIRSTGMGWAIGIGRGGSMFAPWLVGALLDKGWQTPNLYYLFAGMLILSVLSLLALRLSDSLKNPMTGVQKA